MNLIWQSTCKHLPGAFCGEIYLSQMYYTNEVNYVKSCVTYTYIMALYADNDVGLTRHFAFVPHKLCLEQQQYYGSEASLFVAHITNPLVLMAIATDASRDIMMCQFAWRYTLTDRSHRDFKSSNAPEISWCFWTHCTTHRQRVASKDLNPELHTRADPIGRAVSSVHLPSLVFWDCGFEPCRDMDMSLLSAACCQV